MGRWSWDRICLLTIVHSWKFTESNYKILLRNWNCDFWSFLTTCGWGFRILRYDTASSDNWISPFRKNITSCFSQASNFKITPGLNYPWRWRQYLCCKHRFPITWWLICTWKRNPQFSVCLFQLFLGSQIYNAWTTYSTLWISCKVFKHVMRNTGRFKKKVNSLGIDSVGHFEINNFICTSF